MRRNAIRPTFLVAVAVIGTLSSAPRAQSGLPECKGENIVEAARQKDPQGYRDFLATSKTIPNREGLLWRLSKTGAQASYLYGTMHVTDPKAVALARLTAPLIGRSKVVVTELGDAMGGAAAAALSLKIGFRALFRGGNELAIITSAEDRRVVEDAVKNRGIDPAGANRLEPWMIIMLLAVPQCEMERQKDRLPVVDNVIIEMGEKRGKPLAALETIDEQLEVFSAMDRDLTVKILVKMARLGERINDQFVTMLSLYHQRTVGITLEAMRLPLLQAERDVDADADRRFMKRLIEDRNAVMAQRSLPLLLKGGAFVAVGALHLVGETGLVELYRKAGFRVEKVW